MPTNSYLDINRLALKPNRMTQVRTSEWHHSVTQTIIIPVSRKSFNPSREVLIDLESKEMLEKLTLPNKAARARIYRGTARIAWYSIRHCAALP